MNLMHDIVQGRRTVDEARKEFAEQTAAWRLHFAPSDQADTADPDEPAMAGAMARQTVEKAKDALGLGETG
jgi:hypothetical protein